MSERLAQLVDDELKKKRLQEASIFMLISLLLLSIEHKVVDEELNDIVRKNLMPDAAATTDWDAVRDQCLLEGASIYMLAKLLLMQTEKPNGQMFPGLKEEVEKRLAHRQETHGHL